MYVPGYGWGTVQDIGGAIKGNRLDVWFKTVEEAKRWGRQKLNVIVCRG
jgi:3D (Asp-Asp-Asp) domain-containing protein